jgi:dTDP-4-dehydrorhamnose 3,5-epimerase
MKFTNTDIPGIVIVEPDVHRDNRGFFLETYHEEKYREGGIGEVFVQDNHSQSQRDTLRGLHLQLSPPQAKLVRASRGRILDVAVDVRRGSPTFGRHFGLELSSENQLQLYLAPGLAHGFLVLSDLAEVEYKCSRFYDAPSELVISWNDPELGIPWPIEDPILSSKDAGAPQLADLMNRLPEWLS